MTDTDMVKGALSIRKLKNQFYLAPLQWKLVQVWFDRALMLISSSIGGRAEGTDSQCNMSRCLNNKVANQPACLGTYSGQDP